MFKFLKKTELSLKYYLQFILLSVSTVSFISLTELYKNVHDDVIVYSWAVYVLDLMILLLCWDLFIEKRTIHKIAAIIFALVSIILFWLLFRNLPFLNLILGI